MLFPKNRQLILSFVLSILLVAPPFLIKPASADAPKPPPVINRVLEQEWTKEHFVVVRIEEGKQFVDKTTNLAEVTYKVKVLFDNTGALNDRDVTVTGPRAAGGGFTEFSLPDLAIGDAAIFSVTATKQPDAFEAQPGGTLPIGLDVGLPIEREDVGQVVEALKLTSRYLPVKDSKNHHDAVMLLKSKSYFFWALGATILALEGTKENVSIISSDVNYGEFTPNQFLWVDDLLSGTMENLAGWTPAHRALEYRTYLLNHSKRLMSR